MTYGFPLLVVRHRNRHPRFNEVVIHWALLNAPEVLGLFDLRYLPVPQKDWRDWRVLVTWLQDPVQAWSQQAYDDTLELQAMFDEHGVPVVNRVERMTNASKAEGARRIAQAGLRTPKTVLITDPAEFRETLYGIEPPLFVREDWGHESRFFRADSVEEARAVPVEEFERPVVTEVVDTADSRGRYRKFRYVAAGDIGVPHNVLVSEDWHVRGGSAILDPETMAEDAEYVERPDPNHDRFQAARRFLELDVVAFDYTYDRNGNTVVWEANPYPFIHYPVTEDAPSRHRTVAALLKLYLVLGGLPVPEPIELAVALD